MPRPAASFRITGRVQGVGYRFWAIETALRLGLEGWVRNNPDGSVEILAIGFPAAISALGEACLKGPKGCAVTEVERFAEEDDGSVGFEEQAAT